jgi:hypothetical protein
MKVSSTIIHEVAKRLFYNHNPSFNMKMLFKVLILLAVPVFLNQSCRPRDPEPQGYEQGVIVLNAGNFLDNNGSISFLKREASTADKDIFFKANGISLTGGVQGYAEANGIGVILVDNSTVGQDKIELVSVKDFKRIGSFGAPDIENPRDVLAIDNNTVYVSCWGATGSFSNFWPNPGYIAVIDVNTKTIKQKIIVDRGAERMVRHRDAVFVGNSAGVASLQEIDTKQHKVAKSHSIGSAPLPIGVDAFGKLWISYGRAVARLDATSLQVEKEFLLSEHPLKRPSQFAMTPDGQRINFVYSFFDANDGFKEKGEVYQFGVRDERIATSTPVLNRIPTGMRYDPKQGLLYVGSTPSFKQAGHVVRYRSDFSLVDSIQVEIAPSDFYFK